MEEQVAPYVDWLSWHFASLVFRSLVWFIIIISDDFNEEYTNHEWNADRAVETVTYICIYKIRLFNLHTSVTSINRWIKAKFYPYGLTTYNTFRRILVPGRQHWRRRNLAIKLTCEYCDESLWRYDAAYDISMRTTKPTFYDKYSLLRRNPLLGTFSLVT